MPARGAYAPPGHHQQQMNTLDHLHLHNGLDHVPQQTSLKAFKPHSISGRSVTFPNQLKHLGHMQVGQHASRSIPATCRSIPVKTTISDPGAIINRHSKHDIHPAATPSTPSQMATSAGRNHILQREKKQTQHQFLQQGSP
ncbi:hypothetical protein Nepgr_031777 [Nepenthes gracilis]|uniref:Uncharacterized protein n=1 Tax=Nepenthes gracilis TaxID=150966 RepID=A0AAD3TIS0_NEPGR|nr:hypothetical protein Nepgr_031777 [Nepenthes gracilis]